MDPRDCLKKAAYNKHPANSTGSMFQIDKESMQKKKKKQFYSMVSACVCVKHRFLCEIKVTADIFAGNCAHAAINSHAVAIL